MSAVEKESRVEVVVDATVRQVWEVISDVTRVAVPTPVFPDSTQWRIQLEPTGDGRTLIRQSFTVLRAPWLLDRLYARVIPAHQDRDARLAQDLARVGAAARRGARR